MPGAKIPGMATPTAQDMLDLYLQAEQNVLAGQRVRMTVAGVERTLDMADLQFIIEGRKQWQAAVAAQAARATGAPTIGGLGYAVARFDGR